MSIAYEIIGGDHGNYQISEGSKAAPVAYVRRNSIGGGYTASLADGTKAIHMRHMPRADQAAVIMGNLK